MVFISSCRPGENVLPIVGASLEVQVVGKGTVFSEPTGILCGTLGNKCTKFIKETIQLTTAPTDGSVFDYWEDKGSTDYCPERKNPSCTVSKVDGLAPIKLKAVFKSIETPKTDACTQLFGDPKEAPIKFKIDTITFIKFIDPDGHLQFIFNSANLDPVIRTLLLGAILELKKDFEMSMEIAAPFMGITGSYSSQGDTCTLSGKGKGSAAGFTDVESTFSATASTTSTNSLNTSADTVIMDIVYSFGTNGKFPGGKPATIEAQVQLKK